MHSIRVRRAQPDDAPGIARVHVDSWRSTYRGIVAAEVLDRLSTEARASFWQKTLSESTNPGVDYVALDGAGIVGFASGGPERHGIPGYSGEMYAIYLLVSHQRVGLGRRLVKAVARDLLNAGHEAMLVWVLTANPARHFYAALGGRPVASKPITIGPDTLEEVAYGWDSLTALLRKLDSSDD